MVTPEMCCLWESMLAGQFRLQQSNVRRHANITPAIQQAVQQLESEAEESIARSARWVEDELQLSPWNLSSNFVATVQGKGKPVITRNS
jgi:transcription initiation factor TFIID subunit 1